MNERMQDGMAEALRLTQGGRLAEATALIQRTLGGGGFAPSMTPDDHGSNEPTLRVVEDARPDTAPSQPDRKGTHVLRPAPKQPRGFRGTPRPPGGLPGGLPGGWLNDLPGGLLDDLPGGLTGFMPQARAGAPSPEVIPAGGRFKERSYSNRAGGRSYKLYIPSGYVGQAAPLIVMLHGCTQNPNDFAAGTYMNTLAEEHTFLVAYPAQAQGANMNGCWNWFEAAQQQRGRGEPSIIAGITCEIVGEHHVDAGQVYVAGMSAGGAMAAIMAAAYPDLYAAVGVHSGLAPGAARDMSSAFGAMRGGGAGTVPRHAPVAGESDQVVPAIVFHGDRDTTVSPRNADHLLSYYQSAANGRPDASKPAAPVEVRKGQVPGGYSYSHATHRDAGGQAVMEQWTVHGLGHAWSGGSSSGSYTNPKGPDASAEMVRFFKQHQRETVLPAD